MGSHRARHRPDRKQSEELATDLLARLAAETTPRPARTRHASRPSLDPFGTAPFPARPPRPTAQGFLQASSGATRCPGTASRPVWMSTPTPSTAGPATTGTRADHVVEATTGATPVRGRHAGITPPPGHPLGADPALPQPVEDPRAVRHGTADDRSRRSRRLPTDPATPFPIEFAGGNAPAGLAPDATTQSGRARLAGLRVRPLYAAVSATVITATAAVAAAAPAAVAPKTTTPHLARSSTALASAAALDLAVPPTTPAPATPQAVGGPAGLLTAAPMQGATIAEKAAADAKAHATQQATHARATSAQTSAPATNSAPPAPKHAPPKRAAPKAAAAPAGSGVGGRALALARGKLGNPYVWGAAGPSAFDCSGLVVWAFKQLGIALPHSSATLSTMGTPVSKAALQPGDLVFFYSPVSHVGIYAGNGMVLNATQSGEPVQYTKLAYLPFHNAVRITS
jgi:cell wall-associated NlpC family hydrolase